MGPIGKMVRNNMTGDVGLLVKVDKDVWWNSEIAEFYETDMWHVLGSDGKVTISACYYYETLSEGN